MNIFLSLSTDIAEIVFISFFFCEMVMKLYGLGPQLYFKSQFNTFDCVVSYLLSLTFASLFQCFSPMTSHNTPQKESQLAGQGTCGLPISPPQILYNSATVLVRKFTPAMLLSLIFIFVMFFLQVVCCGIIELIISKAEGTSLGISVLRALRLLRLFKFTR